MRKRSLNFLVTAGIACVLVLLAVWAGGVRSNRPDRQIREVSEELDTVKTFLGGFKNFEIIEGPESVGTASQIFDKNGKAVPLLKFKGRLIVVNFWATWCAPCVAELESLANLKDRRKDIEVIAVSKDLIKTPAELAEFLENHHADELDVYYNQGIELDQQFPTRGLPTTYIISPEGKIIYKMEGDTDWSSDDAFAFFDFVLKQN